MSTATRRRTTPAETRSTSLDDEITVKINVRDVVETPAAPKVTVTSPAVAADATAATLKVTWNKPDEHGARHHRYVSGVQRRWNHFLY